MCYALAALFLVSAVCFAALNNQPEPGAEPTGNKPKTESGKINFDAPDIQVHTAEDGVAIVNMASPDADIPDNDAALPDILPSFSAPVMHTSDPATIWQDETAPTSGGFTMPVMMDGGSIGVLSIPDLSLSVRVFESDNEMEDMDKGVAHFKSTSAWEGNIGFSAHNVNFNGTAGYFYSLHTLQKGAVIKYETALGIREYTVENVKEIPESDWNALGRTEDNRVTLITCISGKPSRRLCVQAVEKPL
jgi:LPXTG-site transpeptidase (sortase) family protein